MEKLNNIAKKVFEIESDAIANLSNLLTLDFEKAINAVYQSEGKLIVSGMGKSGLIGKKIAATFASTGTPSFFMHPSEAYHGDLGMIEKEDIVLLISNSGETDELLKLIPFLKSQGNITIAISGNPKSTLAKNTTYHLNVFVVKEACPLQLAPTSSTTATLVMGDALAIALMEKRGFKDSDFALFHPGGSLGKRLLTKVKDIMVSSNLPKVNRKSSFTEIIDVITTGRLGICIVSDNDELVGIITDGDLRRALVSNSKSRFTFIAEEIMSSMPKKINEDEMAIAAEKLMLNNKINSLLVVDHSEKVVGIVQMYDLGK